MAPVVGSGCTPACIRRVLNLCFLFAIRGVKYHSFEEKNIFSKCHNNAFIGKQLKGRVIGIINGDKLFLSEKLH